MKTIRITHSPLSRGLSTVSGHVTIVEALTAAVQRGMNITIGDQSCVPYFTKETKDTKSTVEGVNVHSSSSYSPGNQ